MRHLLSTRTAMIIATAWLASLAVPIRGQESATPLPPSACASLQGMSIPALALRLPTGGAEVQTAVPVAASAKDNPNGDFCKVTGIVKPHNPSSPNLEFEVNLPPRGTAACCRWVAAVTTARSSPGSAGFTLQPATVDNPLKQGFVTLGTDGGHKSTAGFDGSFAMDDEALRNFGKESVKKGHDVAIEIIKKAYGRAPERSYFIGGSQGGHEALDAAARYPNDYDGVVAHYPAYNVTLLHLGSLNAGRAVYEGGGAAWMNPAKVEADHRRRLREVRRPRRREGRHHRPDQGVQHRLRREDACDAPTAPTPATRACPMRSWRRWRRSRPTTSRGLRLRAWTRSRRWPLLEGALFRDRSNFGQVPQPSNPLSGKEPLLYTAGDQTAKFIISRNPKLDTMTVRSDSSGSRALRPLRRSWTSPM